MDEPKLWPEILFLMIPLLVMIGLTLMLGCSRGDAGISGRAARDSIQRADGPGVP